MYSAAFSETASNSVTYWASGGLKTCADVDGLKVMDMADILILLM